ncbi:hypothetical protein OH768_24385 [Streptomyces sp. NBC_01622]|uniref:hypothetical protein n=1 Tax=Streptomyces sp. NBC_01622 TaxID=2975903 RepID=UPI003867FA5C|nr:hypothetical protein OH768_24385 [Streptomyces sp. NBC_01622]
MSDNYSTVIPTDPHGQPDRAAANHAKPTGFASFRIQALHPNRGWLTEEEPASVTAALGHPLRQILAHFQRTSSVPRRPLSTRVTLWIFRGESQARAIATPSRRH